MSTDSIPPTSPQGVLFSLIAEDRPWTVEEMIREKGDNSRLAVVDALAELEGKGLVTRINKRVVCASRAALKADDLSV
jgi:predicted transcriptional regulator